MPADEKPCPEDQMQIEVDDEEGGVTTFFTTEDNFSSEGAD